MALFGIGTRIAFDIVKGKGLLPDYDPGMNRRIMDRVPSIGRGQILTSEDAPARIDAGIEVDLGLGSSEKKRTWPEEVDPVQNKAGVHRSQPGDGSRAPGEYWQHPSP